MKTTQPKMTTTTEQALFPVGTTPMSPNTAFGLRISAFGFPASDS